MLFEGIGSGNSIKVDCLMGRAAEDAEDAQNSLSHRQFTFIIFRTRLRVQHIIINSFTDEGEVE
jgi:hypothetical protein